MRLVGELGEILFQGESRESRSSQGALQVNRYCSDCRSASLKQCLSATHFLLHSRQLCCHVGGGEGGRLKKEALK